MKTVKVCSLSHFKCLKHCDRRYTQKFKQLDTELLEGVARVCIAAFFWLVFCSSSTVAQSEALKKDIADALAAISSNMSALDLSVYGTKHVDASGVLHSDPRLSMSPNTGDTCNGQIQGKGVKRGKRRKGALKVSTSNRFLEEVEHSLSPTEARRRIQGNR